MGILSTKTQPITAIAKMSKMFLCCLVFLTLSAFVMCDDEKMNMEAEEELSRQVRSCVPKPHQCPYYGAHVGCCGGCGVEGCDNSPDSKNPCVCQGEAAQNPWRWWWYEK